ncbi:aldehyde dehydrogenase [Natrialba magadii ATCC 43099]|uniref:Aldehyde dehydrogenase n=1 Tax=Natrialba magadii (strain ATCC 43099 / DSM 3394 / CCM 3739 / CIP 104546 / IAM 13178 / JCM 8861 / NBRC 102185 / NCIMB 2190 / MS3) TaxID=547559 RepID=D3SY54_NATMM|nr:aldehyde dehydrogenase family protein [Natrialba magadii]ADD06025.1 aldehyde dehydrogenase [Natrialba magadii ATCC 43099]ELY30466.1 aldehyde dehydrogenase [Natrialba magadii ATCC 43099]
MAPTPDSILYDSYGPHIDGEFVRSAGDDQFTTTDPATGEPITTLDAASADDVDQAVAVAREAAPEWRSTAPDERGRIATRIADTIRDNADDLAHLESYDQGKPLTQARSDVEGAARFFEYYAGAADKLEGNQVPTDEDSLIVTSREPYGVSGQIIPWNFPLNLTARGVAPAIVAGNTVVAKPAPTTPLSALHLAELCREAGLPDGVFNVVPGGSEPGAALSAHDDVDALTFTGSVATGQAVMESAAKTITPVTLELGGKNPAIVMPDADLDEAAFWIGTGIFTNAGQICSATDRALVHESVYDEVVDRLVARAESTELGPGVDDPDMGPLNHEAHYESVLEYIDAGRDSDATLAAGGEPLEGDGYFVEPTIFTDVDPQSRLAQEEIFGPVLTVIPFADREEAIEIANDVDFGLTGGVFSNDVKQALSMARRIEAGNVYVNEWFGGSVETPFGGVKASGIGREKGLEALDSYLQTRTITVNLDERE